MISFELCWVSNGMVFNLFRILMICYVQLQHFLLDCMHLSVDHVYATCICNYVIMFY